MERKKKNIAELTRYSISEYREREKLPLALLCDSVRSMHNIGAIFRTADAFLYKEIILCGISGIPPHPEIHKTALGAEESVSCRYCSDAVEAAEQMKKQGWKICVLEQTHNSLALEKFKTDSSDKLLLIVGNEVQGVDQRLVDMADYVLEIPQQGTKHSLNVSVSAGIAMWHLYSLYLI